MIEENYLKMKNEYIDSIKRWITEEGEVSPHITIFACLRDNPEDIALIHVPVQGVFMSTEKSKEEFVTNIIPKIAIEVKKKFIPKGVAWTSEVWIRVFDKKEGVPEDWKSKPIDEEALVINIEFESDKELLVYNIIRNGKQINEEGEIKDHVEIIKKELGDWETMTGRFTDLYKKIVADS